MYQLQFSKQARKFYRQSSEKIKNRLDELFDILEEVPIPYHHYDIAKIKGQKNQYRVRLSGTRVLYCVIEIHELIQILKIGTRENFY